MRLVEIDYTQQGLSNLLTLLDFLRQRAHKEGLVGRISFSSLNTMLKNLGQGIDYAGFKHYYDKYDAVKNVVKDFDVDSITLRPFGDEDDQVDQTNPANSDAPSLNKVDTMAKRALRKRS